MTNKLFALALLVSAAPVSAQSYLGPGDQGVNWNSIPSSYPSGTAPADAYEPADAADVGFTEGNWIVTGDQLTTNRAVSGAFYVNPSDSTADRKLRFQCEPVGPILHQDFILKNMSHLHAPFGLVNWSQNSTFATARANPSSGCMGGPLLSQIYIEPQMMDTMPNGALVGRRAQTHTVYYVGKLQSDTQHDETWVRRDTQFIVGANPMNYNDQARRDIYSASGFLYPGGPDTPAGFGGWTCETGASQTTAAVVTRVASRMMSPYGIADQYSSRHLRAPDGSDPWGGGCVQYSASVPALLLLTLYGPNCWDRNNLKAPDGRGHMWYQAGKGDNSVVEACPSTASGQPFGRVPAPQFKSTWAVRNFDDYKNMYFSSDRMSPSSTPADSTSLDPCRQTGPWFCNGSTGHADWGYGAKSSIFDEGQRECLGITVRGVAPQYPGGAECNFGQLSRYRALLAGGTSPNPALTGGCLQILQCFDSVPTKPKELYVAIPNEQSGPTHIMRH